MRLSLSLFALVILITGCSSSYVYQPLENECDNQVLSVNKNFETGRFQSCKWVGDNHIELQLAPENKPINPSPWYAFELQPKQQQTLLVTLKYSHGKHRYSPKMSVDGVNWKQMNEHAVKVSKDKKKATMVFKLNNRNVLVAAQPIIDNPSYKKWLQQLQAKSGNSKLSVIGQSMQGRSLNELALINDNSNSPYIVLLGRQHPPEVTGAMAMKVFVERLLADDELATAFREQFNLLVYPNINPDGVANGNWRHNMGGLDLNRDWGPFTQAETKQVIEAIDGHVNSADVWGMLDFHSTNKDIFYTQSDQEASRFPFFTNEWITAINNDNSPLNFKRKGSHNRSLPTSKTYFYERFKVPAITFEIDDKSKLSDIKVSAEIAAEHYMTQLIKRKQLL